LWLGILFAFSGCGKPASEPAPPGREKWPVVIIGAGAGGLSAGATLTKAGVKALILEQQDKPGGYMTGFSRGDYRFEVSLHLMDGLDEGGMTRELFKKLDILDKVKLIKVDPLYRAVFPDLTIDVPADINTYQKMLVEKFPHEAKGINELFQALSEIGQDIVDLSGLMEKPLSGQILAFPLVPFRNWDFIRNFNTNLDEFMKRYIKDPKVNAVVLELASFMGVPPSKTPAVIIGALFDSYYRKGAYQFEGGSQAVSDALARVIREKGGEVRLNTRVEKILIKNGRAVGVRTKAGDEIYADYVISNADGYNTYLTLVGEEYLKPKFVKYVKSLEPGVSTVAVFMGLNMDLKKAGLGNVHEIFYNPSYEVEDLWKSFETMNVENTMLIVSLYSNVDPTSAPPGKSVISITTGAPYDWENKWRINQGYDAYKALKEEIGQRLIKVAEKMVPGLSGAIEEIEIATPLTNERYTSNYRGSIIGWASTQEQSLLKRMKQKSPVDRLYLAGAWTFPSGGQSACLMSGYLTAKMILGEIR
jgi:prolycopene isomerase